MERDRIDSTRDVAPLKAAEDAVVLDSDKLNADEVFEQILALVK
jgi:cytidylate kinase